MRLNKDPSKREIRLNSTIACRHAIVEFYEHRLIFFLPARGKEVNVVGVTLVRMENGKIAEESAPSDLLSV
jgi:hypothetical protein